jgi:ubiquinone/menaquinone biosynthesis C-methylase UbiE
MIRLAHKRLLRTEFAVEFLDLPGERIPLEDGAVDTVVSTFTLCIIPGVGDAIRGMRRVLRPGGKLIFFEHRLAPEPHVRRWQQWLEPVHGRLFGGLRLTRDIPSLIADGGFEIEQMEAAYLAAFPKSLTYCCWGTAVARVKPVL